MIFSFYETRPGRAIGVLCSRKSTAGHRKVPEKAGMLTPARKDWLDKKERFFRNKGVNSTPAILDTPPWGHGSFANLEEAARAASGGYHTSDRNPFIVISM